MVDIYYLKWSLVEYWPRFGDWAWILPASVYDDTSLHFSVSPKSGPWVFKMLLNTNISVLLTSVFFRKALSSGGLMVKALWVTYIIPLCGLNFGRGWMSVVVWLSHTPQMEYMKHFKKMYFSVLRWGPRLTTHVPSCHGLGKLIGYKTRLKVSSLYAHVG